MYLSDSLPREWTGGTGTRSADSVATCPRPLASGFAFAAPGERRRVIIPAARRGFQPGDDLVRRPGVVTLQPTSLEDALDRFGHVQPTATQRCIEGHGAMREEAANQRRGQVPSQIIPDERQPQRRGLLWQGNADGQSLLPAFPLAAILGGAPDRWLRQRREDGLPFALEPGMEDGVGGLARALDANLTGGRMEQGEVFRRPTRRYSCG